VNGGIAESAPRSDAGPDRRSTGRVFELVQNAKSSVA
jgi:hypothetical protein